MGPQTAARRGMTLAAFSLLVSCGIGTGSTRKPKFVWPAPPAVAIQPDDFPTADAVYLARFAELRFPNAKDPTSGFALTVHARVQILTPGGRGRSRVVIPVDSWSALQDVEARSYDAAAAASNGDLGAVNLPRNSVAYAPLTQSGILYNDSRLAAFDIPNAEPGRIVEYRYTIRGRQIFGLPNWQLDAPLPVREGRLTVVVPAGWELKWGFAEAGEPSAEAPAPERTPNPDGSETLVWVANDLPALEPDPMGLPLDHLARQLSFAVASAPNVAFAEWADVAHFYRGLTSELATAPAPALAELSRTTGDASREPAEAIYDFVRDAIRYVAIEQGIGALKPHPAAEVFDARLGDCKDMSTLLVGLYAHHGVTAYPALVSTRAHARFHPDVPTVSAFDHAIVALPKPDGGFTFVDPTAKHYPFGEIPWGIQGRPALVVGAEIGEVVELPMHGTERNSQEMHWQLSEKQSELTITARGEPSHGWRGFGEGSAAEARLADRVEMLLGDLEAAEVQSATIEREGDGVIVRATLATPHLIHSAGGRRLVPLGPFFGHADEVRVPAERRSPVELGFPGSFVVRLSFALPRGARVEHAPSHSGLDLSVASYSLNSKSSGGKVELIRTFVRKQARVPPELLAEIRQVSEMFTADSREALVLR